MKVLIISRGKLELARAHFTRPVVTIGRSPICDVVLRAEGIAPIHFLMEWVGTGEFDPSQGSWSIFDISESNEDQSGEGILVDEEPVQFKDLRIALVEDRLENTPQIGGNISAALSMASAAQGSGKAGSILELVQIRTDSGAIEEVLHLSPRKIVKPVRPLGGIPEFKLQVPALDKRGAMQILFQEMPEAVVLKRGVPLEKKDLHEITDHDILEVQWKGRRFILRFVDEAQIPVVERGKKDPLLRKISKIAAAVCALLLLLFLFIFRNGPEVPPPTPPRVATVEVREIPPTQPKEVIKSVPQTAPAVGVKTETEPTHKKQASAAAPQFKSEADTKRRTGLNSPAKNADVNSIGILGALKGTGPKGPGIKADRILNEGVLTQSVSSKTDDSKIVIKNPPTGGIGAGNVGARHHSNSELAAASTTLGGSHKMAPSSSGPIAGEGGKPGFTQGSVIGGTGSSVGSGTNVGSLDMGSPDVSGGLDRETVRRIILQYRSQIRTCYERALLSSPKLAGRVTYNWTISSAGPVVKASIIKSNVGSPVLESCVMGVIKSMNFPAAKNGQPTIVIYPFVFQARS